jgi:hypothetical protein
METVMIDRLVLEAFTITIITTTIIIYFNNSLNYKWLSTRFDMNSFTKTNVERFHIDHLRDFQMGTSILNKDSLCIPLSYL